MTGRTGLLHAVAASAADSPALLRSLGAALLFATTSGCAMHLDRSLADDRTLGWTCQRRSAEDRRLWVNLVLDANGHPVSRSVGWRYQRLAEQPDIAGTDLFWTIPGTGPWYARVERADFDFASTIRPVGAVDATLELDGTVVAREKVLDRQSARRLRDAAAWGATLRLDAGSGSATLLHAASSARILVDGEDGWRISIVPVRLPDWPIVDRQVAEALSALDRDALNFTNRCERATGPEIDPAAAE